MSDTFPSSQRPQSFHPDFDRDVRMVVLCVEGQGFKVDAARLSTHSKFLDTMLGDHGGYLGSSKEGTIDNPIIVAGCTACAFANFLKWLNHESWAPLVAEHAAQLLDVLHISHMWDILPGVQFASRQLHFFDMPAARRLEIAARYHLRDWMPEVVRSLLAIPLNDYSKEDLAVIGFKTYIAISTAKESIAAERKRFGNHPAYPKNVDNGPYCSNSEKCKQIWSDKWHCIVARLINHSTDPLPLTRIPEILDKIDYEGMHKNCRLWLISLVRQSDSLLKEECMIQDAVALIRGMLMR